MSACTLPSADEPLSPAHTAGFRLRLAADGRALACSVRMAHSFWQRARGLLGHTPLGQAQALWIAPCSSIHTFGMRYAIDVVFLDGQDDILRIAPAVPPGRFRLCAGARSTVELRAGEAAVLGLRPGQRIAALAAKAMEVEVEAKAEDGPAAPTHRAA